MVIVALQDTHFNNPAVYAFSEMGLDVNMLLLGDANSVKSYKTQYGALVWLLPAVAGLSGATLRIPNSFMIAIAGGRNTIAMTTLLLLIPMVILGFALLDPNVSFYTLVLVATMAGVGGGAFASSMSNISFFFPRRMQGLSLGLNAGLGNLGVSVMQFLIPAVLSVGLFGALSGTEFLADVETSRTNFPPNAAFVWVPLLAICIVAAWFKMNNLPQHDVADTKKSLSRFFTLEFFGYIGAGVGTVLLIFIVPNISSLISDASIQAGLKVISYLVIVIICIVTTLFIMKKFSNKETKERLDVQFKIFDNKHNWIMTYLYIATFGSFIGFSQAFGNLIRNYFRYDILVDGVNITVGPNPLTYAFLGALVGSLIRPVGGWLSDKFGGAKVTHWDFIVMILSTIGVGFVLSLTKISSTPDEYFIYFLVLFLILFITTGIGNGSTFRMVPIIFEREQAGPVLGWISAVAAYGAFIIPAMFGVALAINAPDIAMYVFAIYYITCLVLNWYYYARKNAEMPC
jgi:NNP family nitrate/nitrite transporter-like MFS transporter